MLPLFDVYQQCSRIIHCISLTSLNKETFCKIFFIPRTHSLSHIYTHTTRLYHCQWQNEILVKHHKYMTAAVYILYPFCVHQTICHNHRSHERQPEKNVESNFKKIDTNSKTFHPVTNYMDVKKFYLNEIKSKRKSMASIPDFIEETTLMVMTMMTGRLSNSRKRLFHHFLLQHFCLIQFLWQTISRHQNDLDFKNAFRFLVIVPSTSFLGNSIRSPKNETFNASWPCCRYPNTTKEPTSTQKQIYFVYFVICIFFKYYIDYFFLDFFVHVFHASDLDIALDAILVCADTILKCRE